MQFEWNKLFTSKEKALGATSEEILEAERSVASAITEAEVQRVLASQQNPYPRGHPWHERYKPFDPRQWRFPGRPFPPSYVSLLQWSNGGLFEGEKYGLLPLFACLDVRDWMFQYHFPEYMPGALPFGMNGSGEFYILDMRQEPGNDGEFPVIRAGAGALAYDEADTLGSSIWLAFSGNE